MTALRHSRPLAAAIIVLTALPGCAPPTGGEHEEQLTIQMCLDASVEPACVEHGAATDEDRVEVEILLDQTPTVVSYAYNTRQEAYEEFRENFEGQEEVLAEVQPGDLPDRYLVRFDQSGHRQNLAPTLAGMCGVGEVTFVVNPEEPLVRFPGTGAEC